MSLHPHNPWAEIGWALRGDRLVHISEVDRGLTCSCVCVGCGRPLVAKKGQLRRHHFSHGAQGACTGALETLLHRLAKELLSEAQLIRLPEYRYVQTFRPRFGLPLSIDQLVVPARVMSIGKATLEQRLGGIVPDIILECSGERLLIEIAVSHKVDRAKLRRVRRLNIPLVEVQIDNYTLNLDRVSLRHKLIDSLGGKKWLFHPLQRTHEREWVSRRRDAMRRDRNQRARARHMEAFPRTQPERPRPPGAAEVNPTASAGSGSPKSGWFAGNAWAENFNRRHGRYPSLEDTRAFAARKTGKP